MLKIGGDWKAVVLLIAISFEILSLIQMLVSPSSLRTSSGLFSKADAGIFEALSPLSVLLLVSLLYYFPAIRLWIWITRHSTTAMTLSRRVRAILRAALSHVLRKEVGEEEIKPSYGRLLLAVGVLSSLAVVYFPYRPDLNPAGMPVGLDISIYSGWMRQMLSIPLGDRLQYALAIGSEGSRPVFLLLLYSIAYLSNAGPETVVKFSPMILVPLLVTASYSFVRLGTGDGRRAGLTALLTAVSPVVTVGMWATYYTNWLALAETFLLFGLLLINLRAQSIWKNIGLVALSLALLLTHPWTWILVLSVTSLFVSSLYGNPNLKAGVISLSYLMISGITVAILKAFEFGGFGIANAIRYTLDQSSSPINQLLMFWPDVTKGLTQTYDGLLMNSALLALGLLAVTRLRFSAIYDRLLILWILIASIPFLFVGSYVQTRIVFDLPIAVLASGGLALVQSNVGQKKHLGTLILILVLVFNTNYAVRSMIQL